MGRVHETLPDAKQILSMSFHMTNERTLQQLGGASVPDK